MPSREQGFQLVEKQTARPLMKNLPGSYGLRAPGILSYPDHSEGWRVYQNIAPLLVDDRTREKVAEQFLTPTEAKAEKRRLETRRRAARAAMLAPDPDPFGSKGFTL